MKTIKIRNTKTNKTTPRKVDIEDIDPTHALVCLCSEVHEYLGGNDIKVSSDDLLDLVINSLLNPLVVNEVCEEVAFFLGIDE